MRVDLCTTTSPPADPFYHTLAFAVLVSSCWRGRESKLLRISQCAHVVSFRHDGGPGEPKAKPLGEMTELCRFSSSCALASAAFTYFNESNGALSWFFAIRKKIIQNIATIQFFDTTFAPPGLKLGRWPLDCARYANQDSAMISPPCRSVGCVAERKFSPGRALSIDRTAD